MRDQEWLDNKLNYIWNNHFPDHNLVNPIQIRFGKISRKRLGSIYLSNDQISIITLSGIFKDERIPESVLFETIAHELIHYIHGFSSINKRQFAFPHQGGIIEKEMKERNIFDIYKESKEWMKENWVDFVFINYPLKTAKRRRRRSVLRVLRFKKSYR